MSFEPCPRCKSNRIVPIGKFIIFFAMFGFGGLMMLAGFILPILWILAFAFILLSPVSFFMPKFLHCKDCKHSWKTIKKLETPAN